MAIKQQMMAIFTHQDVLGLEVEVHDGVQVQVGDRVRDLPQQARRVVLAVCPLVHQPIEKLAARRELCRAKRCLVWCGMRLRDVDVM